MTRDEVIERIARQQCDGKGYVLFDDLGHIAQATWKQDVIEIIRQLQPGDKVGEGMVVVEEEELNALRLLKPLKIRKISK